MTAFREWEAELMQKLADTKLYEFSAIFDETLVSRDKKISTLESNLDALTEDEFLKLETLYWEKCLKIPETTLEQMENLIELARRNSSDEISSSTCGIVLRHESESVDNESDQERSINMTSFFAQTNRNLIKSMRIYLEKTAEEITMLYLKLNSVPKKIQETDAMKSYIKDKTGLLRLGIVKYFSDNNTPDFNGENLKTLTDFLKDKISSRTLTLNDKDKIMNLTAFVSEHQQRPRSDFTI